MLLTPILGHTFTLQRQGCYVLIAVDCVNDLGKKDKVKKKGLFEMISLTSSTTQKFPLVFIVA